MAAKISHKDLRAWWHCYLKAEGPPAWLLAGMLSVLRLNGLHCGVRLVP